MRNFRDSLVLYARKVDGGKSTNVATYLKQFNFMDKYFSGGVPPSHEEEGFL